MKTKVLLASGIAMILSIAACTSNGDKTGNDSVATDTSMPDTNIVQTADTAMYDMAHADISGTKPDTTVSGTAHFARKGNKVELTLNLTIPKKANSSVAVHFHEHGDCGNMGEGAHGHWNPTNENHGKWGSAAFHSGDIGNIKLDAAGKATFKLETDRWTIGGPASTNILNHAIIVHAGVDDYKTQPTGNSGSRIGCGVIDKM